MDKETHNHNLYFFIAFLFYIHSNIHELLLTPHHGTYHLQYLNIKIEKTELEVVQKYDLKFKYRFQKNSKHTSTYVQTIDTRVDIPYLSQYHQSQ